MRHLSLFSGIGGLDLAAEWAGFETVGQCEFADYPTKILEKHWPNVPRWRDVRDVTAESVREKCGTVDIASGGFPCQPHSCAGLRKAGEDERDLWGEYARVVREVKPRWVVAENVSGLLSSDNGRFFPRVLRDLAINGYCVEWHSIPAAAFGAAHFRNRVFLLAFDPDRINDRTIKANKGLQQASESGRVYRPILRAEWEVDTCSGRPVIPTKNRQYFDCESRVDRVSYGTPNRSHRLRSLGNMVVPQQAYPIFKAIMDIERGVIT